MLCYHSPIFLEHDTGLHPENAERIRPAIRLLDQLSLHFGCVRPSWEEVTLERLERVHSSAYIESVRMLCEQGGGRIEEETVVGPKSFHVARMAVGAVCDAVERVLLGDEKRAFCLVRPPGHHALPDTGMGFCVFNNVAVGARLAIDEFELNRVLIVDWDAHHGNGTQEIFWDEEKVGYFSIHLQDIFPHTGKTEETGIGPAQQTTLNVPVAAGISREEYRKLFAENVDRFAHHIRPELILISAGFDTHREDPLGSLRLETEDFAFLTRCVLDVAKLYSGGRVVSVLEGGYNPHALAACLESHLHELLSA